MKKLIATATLLLALLTSANAQGNLQFNQVINGEFSTVVAYTTTVMGTFTVPVGKVWKIESTSQMYDDGSYVYSQGKPVFIDNHLVWEKTNYYSSAGQLPLWLSAGTYTVKATGSGSTLVFSYSAIEFNVVP